MVVRDTKDWIFQSLRLDRECVVGYSVKVGLRLSGKKIADGKANLERYRNKLISSASHIYRIAGSNLLIIYPIGGGEYPGPDYL